MRKSNKKSTLATIAIILLIAVFVLIHYFSSSDITNDVSKMTANAEKLYN